SALAKFVLREPESDALEQWALASEIRLITAALTPTELPRAVARSNRDLLPAARATLASCGIVTLAATVYEAAGRLGPPDLRPPRILRHRHPRRLGLRGGRPPRTARAALPRRDPPHRRTQPRQPARRVPHLRRPPRRGRPGRRDPRPKHRRLAVPPNRPATG